MFKSFDKQNGALNVVRFCLYHISFGALKPSKPTNAVRVGIAIP